MCMCYVYTHNKKGLFTAFYAEKALKARSILIDSARIIKKIAEISKKDLTNETGGCILAPSNGKGVVSGEGS